MSNGAKINPETDAAIHRILEAMEAQPGEGDKIIIFTPKEAEALKEVASFWDSLKGAQKLAQWVGGGLKWFAAIVLAYGAAKAGLFDWIRAGVK